MAVAQPLVARKVKPNDWYGVRTPKTKANADIWYKANEYGGRVIRALGVGVGVAAVVLLPLAYWSVSAYALACAAALLIGTLGMAVLNVKYIARL